MHSFEDLGYFCVDNLPSSLIGNTFTGMPGQPDEHRRLAVVCDARNRDFFANLTAELAKLKAQGIGYRILFLDAADEKLVARYKSSRRRHPLCADGASIAQGIDRERDLLFEVREAAHHVVDTADILPGSLATIRALFAPGSEQQGLAVTVYSFGFKHGAPRDADLVMDVRFLPNPYYEPAAARARPGLDAPVRDYVLYRAETERVRGRAGGRCSDCVMPGYVAEEPKRPLAIAVGCTGGQHRCVALAESTGEYLKAQGYRVSVRRTATSALAEGSADEPPSRRTRRRRPPAFRDGGRPLQPAPAGEAASAAGPQA